MAKKWTKIAGSLTLAGALLLTATACGNNSSSSESKTSQTSSSSTSSTKSSESSTSQSSTSSSSTSSSKTVKTSDIKLTQNDAINKFHEKYSGKDVKEIDLETENGSYVYNVDGFDTTHEYEVKINASSGKIISSKAEKLDEKNEKALDVAKLISRDEATKVAEDKVKGTAQKWTLKYNDSKVAVWDVEVVNGTKKTEVEINATNKKVIKTEVED